MWFDTASSLLSPCHCQCQCQWHPTGSISAAGSARFRCLIMPAFDSCARLHLGSKMLSHKCQQQHCQRHPTQPFASHHICMRRAADQTYSSSRSLLRSCRAAAGHEQDLVGCVNRRRALQAAAGALLLVPAAVSWPGKNNSNLLIETTCSICEHHY